MKQKRLQIFEFVFCEKHRREPAVPQHMHTIVIFSWINDMGFLISVNSLGAFYYDKISRVLF